MKNILVGIFLMAGCLVAVAKQAKEKKKAKDGNEIVSVAVQHTGCFGRCPTYSIEVSNDGYAKYTGIRFIKDSGVYKKNIGKEKAMQIINRFVTYRADTCKDIYPARITDLPGIMYTIKYRNKKTKTIYDTPNDGPIVLLTLRVRIDSLANGEQLDKGWKRIAPAQKKKK